MWLVSGSAAAADILGVRSATVSAWEAQGLLKEMAIGIRDAAQGRREYRAEDVRRVRSEMTMEVRTSSEDGLPPAAR